MDREDLERRVYHKLKKHGGGAPLRALAEDLWSEDVGKSGKYAGLEEYSRKISSALRRLQTKGWVFNHDSGGDLAIWKGIKRGRFWSTRHQVQRDFGYGDDLLRPTKGSEPAESRPTESNPDAAAAKRRAMRG